MHARAVWAAMFLAALGCSGGGDSPTEPPPPPQQPITALQLTLEGSLSLVEGNKVQYFASAKLSNGTTITVNQGAGWSSSNILVATVDKGMVTAITPGTTTITVTYSGLSAELALTVKSSRPAWSDWPGMSMAQSLYIEAHILQGYGLRRFASVGSAVTTIKVWAQPAFPRQTLEAAHSLWEAALEGKVRFELVSDSASAQMRHIFNPAGVEPGKCATAPPTRIIGYVIEEAVASYMPRTASGCGWHADNMLWIMGHEIGHMLGVWDHPKDGSVMDEPVKKFAMTELLSRSLIWSYTTTPGTWPLPAQQGNTGG